MDVRRIGRSGWRGRLFARRAPGRPVAPEVLRVFGRPQLRKPVMVVSFEGWNDAGEASSMATSFLARAWSAEPFAEIDPEEFFDFTEVRPEVSIVEGRSRQIAWPATVVSAALLSGGPRDVILVRGHEPNLRWRTYSAIVVELARALRVEEVITLGAYLAEITHSRPVPVSAATSDESVLDEHRLAASAYEGPTGIVAVLGLALADAGIPTTSVWASVPCYSIPLSAKAALALVQAVERIVGCSVDATELVEQASEYEQRMDQLVAEDENVAAYVARIEEMEDVVGTELSAEGLAEEAERYLREKRSR